MTAALRATTSRLGSGLLRDVLVHHGYFERWAMVAELTASISFGGLAFAARWRLGCRTPRRVVARARDPRVQFEDFPRIGALGVFTPGRVSIESREGPVLAERFSPRRYFGSLRRQVYWDRLDLLYFCGYACWNYLTSPFNLALPGVEAVEIDPWLERGRRYRRLQVTFPDDFPTHSPRQVLYFDETLRLRRLDYDPHVFGTWAHAAQHCTRYQEFDGIAVPTRRRVYPRSAGGTARSAPLLVWINVHHMAFTEYGPGPGADGKQRDGPVV